MLSTYVQNMGKISTGIQILFPNLHPESQLTTSEDSPDSPSPPESLQFNSAQFSNRKIALLCHCNTTQTESVMIWNSLFCFSIFIYFHHQYYSVPYSVSSCTPVTSLCFCKILARTRPSLRLHYSVIFGTLLRTWFTNLIFWNFPLLS